MLLAALTVGLVVAWWRLAARFSWPATLMVAWLVVPAYIVTVAGLVWQPLFIVRYFIIFAPPLLVAIAVVSRGFVEPLWPWRSSPWS